MMSSSLLRGLLVLPCQPFKNCIHPEWGKGLRKSLWIPHIQAIPFLNFCHLAGASEPQIPGQPGTRTVSSPRQSILWTVKCSPHCAIKICAITLYLFVTAYTLVHPCISLYYIPILSSIAQLYIKFILFFKKKLYLYLHVCFFILILSFIVSVLLLSLFTGSLWQ